MPGFAPSNHNRRTALAVIVALCLLHPLSPARAGGDGGGNDSRRPSKPPVIKKKYSQAEFVRLSKREIDHIYTYSHGGSYTPEIFGFSRYLDGYIFTMAEMSRRRTQRLVREMSNLSDPKARRARLAREVENSKRELGRLETALKRAKARKSKAVIAETELRIAREQLYLDGAKRWLKDPSEGTK